MRVLILDSAQGLLGPVLQSCQGVPGLAVHVLTRDPARSVRFSRFVGSASFWPPEKDQGKDLDTIAAEIERTGADILLPIDEPSIAFASANRKPLARLTNLVPLPDPETLETARDKWLLSKFMAARDIPQPRTIRVSEARVEELETFPFPALIKKRKGSGGNGIVTFQNQNVFSSYLEENDLPKEDYILQEMLGGGEIDCSLLAQDGKILAHTIQQPLFTKTGFDFARAVEFVHDPEAFELTRRLISELDYSGIAHVDIIRDHRSKELKILEINPRYWGSLVGSSLAGVNFPHLALRAALGEHLPEPGFQEIRYSTAREAVRLRMAFLRNRGGVKIPFSQTNLKNYLADPLPQMVAGLRKIATRLGLKR
jgi:predicted ATP-grasp superfamily ATP-dependent carboligase